MCIPIPFHPANADRWEWQTNRQLELKLIEQTIVPDEERLTERRNRRDKPCGNRRKEAKESFAG